MQAAAQVPGYRHFRSHPAAGTVPVCVRSLQLKQFKVPSEQTQREVMPSERKKSSCVGYTQTRQHLGFARVSEGEVPGIHVT